MCRQVKRGPWVGGFGGWVGGGMQPRARGLSIKGYIALPTASYGQPPLPPSFPTPPIKNKDGLQYHSRETCGKCAKVKYPFPHKQEAFEVVARLKLIFAAIADQPISMQCKTDSFMKFTPLHQPHSHTHGHFRPQDLKDRIECRPDHLYGSQGIESLLLEELILTIVLHFDCGSITSSLGILKYLQMFFC